MCWFKRCLIFLVFTGPLGDPLAYSQDPESYNPMAGWVDVLQYDLEIWLDPASADIKGKQIVTLKLLKPVQQLNLNLEDLIVDTLYCPTAGLNYSYDGSSIRIEFNRRMARNKKLDIIIRYHGQPSDGMILKNQSGHFTAFADNWASRARNWFPCIDHPSDKASFQSTVHLPREFEVIGNGSKLGESENLGQRTVIHRIDQPIATYCMVIGATQFSITRTKSPGGLPLLYYTYPRDSVVAMGSFSRIPDMVHFYDSLIGPYAYPQLAFVQSSTRFGGMENSSVIFLNDGGRVFKAQSEPEELLAHEVAHQWFGDAVTLSDWSELWLSEGFATYFSALYFESREGKIRFDSIINQTKKEYLNQQPHLYPVIFNGYPRLFQLLNAENYQKGGLFLHALRLKIGDPAFFNSIRKYYSRFKNKNATSFDFRSVVESVSRQKLKPFFNRWLEHAGLPEQVK
ncbi:MAG: M1 family metallopeptidase [Saprospiraceae bacterium]|nr:M1 family metallopeptidase [Saprospiraceae bacterium]